MFSNALCRKEQKPMKIVYLDCGMGAAGDMLLAALFELCPKQEDILNELNHLGIPGVEFLAEKTEKCGILGTHMRVMVHGEEEEAGYAPEDDTTYGCIHEHSHEHSHGNGRNHECCGADKYSYDGHMHEHHHTDEHGHEHHHADGYSGEHDHGSAYHHTHHHDHHHAGMVQIREWIGGLRVSEKVKKDALAVYQLIAEAESKAHGKSVEEVHFHEVGMLDAVADVVGVCLLIEKLEVEQIFASAVHVGSGQVRCAHGILPVPAPATAYLLQDVPMYGGNIRGELCTPTGAALLKYFVAQFGVMPPMAAEKIGYGMGKKDFSAANCVRAFLGRTRNREQDNPAKADSIVELRCNLDDMTGEEIGYACETLFKEGALDVYTVGIGMKKSRPGVLLVCLCRASDICRMEELIFCHTTTLGIRRVWCERSVLSRTFEQVETPWGVVRKKLSHFPDQERVVREKLEYEDLAKIAEKTGLSIAEIRRRIGILY